MIAELKVAIEMASPGTPSLTALRIAEVVAERIHEAKAEAWDEGYKAAQEIVELDGQKVWAHTVFPEGYEGNPYREAAEAQPAPKLECHCVGGPHGGYTCEGCR